MHTVVLMTADARSDLLHDMDEWGPEKVVCVSDRRTGMRGVLVIDNTARGMGKGGTRMSPVLTVGEVSRLARTMTWKWAAVDLYFGGAKAGILGDPGSPDKEAILRSFARALRNEVPAEYVFGLDMGLSEADAAVFADELGDRGGSTGLPAELGGLPYDKLGVTGYGVAESVDAAAGVIGLDLTGARVAVQGFGAVGQATCERLVELGAVVVSTSTAVGAVHDPDGLDVARLAALRAEVGDACVREYGGATDPDETLRVEADVLVPAARQDVLDASIARSTSVRLVVEGANMPTTPEARTILVERGVVVVPDFIANAGGIVAAAFSMDACRSPFRVDPADVFPVIADKMRRNTVTVVEQARATGATTHEAAVAIAQERVATAMRLRGHVHRFDGGEVPA